MQGLRDLSPQALSRKHPSVYRSAIVHHGSIGRAFKEIGIDYPFEEISDWKSKVGPFFGKLPDTVIAECVNVSVNTIRMLRKKLGIERYLKRRIFEEVI